MAVIINPDGLDFGELAISPATPASGRVIIYAKNDGKFYRKDDTGTETELGLATVSSADVTYTPNDTADWNSSSDPGDVNDALDQLADRVKAIEAGGTNLTARNAAGSVTISDTSTLTFPNGWIASGGSNVAVISDVTNNYTPDDSGHWDSTAPATKTSGLDKLASRTRQAYGILTYSSETVSGGSNSNLQFNLATVVVDKNMNFDFGTTAEQIPVPYPGLYQYHIDFSLYVSSAPLSNTLLIGFYDQSSANFATWDSDMLRENIAAMRGQLTGFCYHSSTSNYVTVQIDNSLNATNTIDVTYRVTVTRVSGDD